jgi:hypothetical protein
MPRSSTVAKETMAFCTSCKMDLNHVIVAMQGDRVAKVQCRTCKKEHVYKAPKGITEPPPKDEKPLKKTRAKKSKDAADEGAPTSIEAEWEKLMAAHKAAPMRPYGMKTVFALGDKLNHPTFGEGIVGKLIYPNKLEVIFQHEMKVLIHGGTPTSIG